MQKSSLPIYKGVIDSLSKKGDGVGDFSCGDLPPKRLDVPYTIVGEEVAVFSPHISKRTWPLEILSPSPERIAPVCIHFGTCGGCTYQHMSYQEQLRQKENYVRSLFGPKSVLPILPAIKEWRYRNKMEFTFSSDKEGSRYLGLISKESKGRVFNIQECPISDPFVVEALAAVRRFWEKSGLLAYHPYRDTGSLRTVHIRTSERTGDKMVALQVSGRPEFALNKEQVALFKSEIEPLGASCFIIIQQALKGRPTQFFELHLGGKDHIEEHLTVGGETISFRVSPRAFFQPNTLMAEVIYQKAVDMLDIQEGHIVYDLFCGTGTLSIFASKRAKEVVGIELSFEAIVDAEENAKRNGITNVRFIQGDVGRVLEREKLLAPHSVLVDPPRTGLTPQQIEQVALLNAKKVLYISCNPKTLAQNVETFLGMGYHLECVQPIDQFAMTPHLEAIALLVQTKEMR